MTTATDTAQARAVRHLQRGMPTSEGAGVRLTRLIGQPGLDMVDPFLLLDEFKSDRPQDYVAGFPEHPHRGFETVTYMLAGRVRHGDNKGHAGVIEPGGVQWMTAGRGIVHSEMPEQEDGLLWGFQLWVNLPAAEKMKAPAYQEFPAGRIPTEGRDGGVTVRVIAGTTSRGTAGPVAGIPTEPLYLDVAIPAGAAFEEAVSAGHSAFVYPYQGAVTVHDGEATEVAAGHVAILGPGDVVRLAAGSEDARLLLVAGRPLAEPVARYGPFVMSTKAELMQAFQDFQNGEL
jgi:redox-sensitive bicupin YhaK (pirin superfamily)